MPAARKFCTSCGVPVQPSLRYCTSCGAPVGDIPPGVTTGLSFPPGDHTERKPAGMKRAPETLPGLVVMIVRGIADNIRGTATGMIKGMIIAFIVVVFLNTLLQVTDLSQDAIADSVIAAAGLSSSPNALLFWFLFSAILAFFWSQIVSLGLRGTISKAGTLPRWIHGSGSVCGIVAVPLILAGIAAALAIRLYILSAINSIGFLILMFGILFSQQESLSILAMSLGYSDLHRIFRKGTPYIPAPAFPVMGVLGALLGFIIVVVIADSLAIIAIVVVLMLVVSVVIWYRKKKAATGKTPAAGTTPPGRNVP